MVRAIQFNTAKAEAVVSGVTPPVQLVTEAGFIIVRRCDLAGEGGAASGFEHNFIVKNIDGYQIEITVRFDTPAIKQLVARSNDDFINSSFWLAAAERHLADYLDENGDFPPDASLTISDPNLDDIDSISRWNRGSDF